MLAALLKGERPPLQDIIFLRTTLLKSYDIYRPVNLGAQIKATNIDKEAVAFIRRMGGETEEVDGNSGSNDGSSSGPDTEDVEVSRTPHGNSHGNLHGNTLHMYIVRHEMNETQSTAVYGSVRAR